MTKIDWREWNEESFREARETNRPVLLAISAVWCHWCHVMDETTYGDPRVADMVNRLFVPIRVDNDRRPDINTRYNMGGWPSTVFLTPEADILTGSTYLPPEQMIDLMRRVSDVYSSNREDLTTRAKEMRKEIRESREAAAESATLLTEGYVSHVLRQIAASYDSRYGGFGTQQKFPHTDALDLLIREYHRTGDKDLLEMFTTTLDAMYSGGIHDTVNGGFFRYATQSNWSIPHYEKMLEDNASLMATYISAYQETNDWKYLDAALDIHRYLKSWLYDPENGIFYGSQEADEEYYELSAGERAKRQAPGVDKTVYTNWNAMAVYGYLRLYQVTLDPEFKEMALRCLDFLDSNLRSDDGMFAHFYDGLPRQSGMLNDQVHMLWAYLAAYESTGNVEFKESAAELAGRMWEEYHDDEDGLFDVTIRRMKEERLIFRDKALNDNALAARSFDRLSFMTHDPLWKRYTEAVLRSLVGVYEAYGMMAAPFALAVAETMDEPVRVNIAGDKESYRTIQLLEQALKTREPRKIIQVMDPSYMETELDELGYVMPEEPTAYICHGATCQAPINDPEMLASAVAVAGGHAVDFEEA